MTEPPKQVLVNNLAALAGLPPPDLSKQGDIGFATARVHLTREAVKGGATWMEIAVLHGHRNPKLAKRNHHRLEAELLAELTRRQNAN